MYHELKWHETFAIKDWEELLTPIQLSCFCVRTFFWNLLYRRWWINIYELRSCLFGWTKFLFSEVLNSLDRIKSIEIERITLFGRVFQFEAFVWSFYEKSSYGLFQKTFFPFKKLIFFPIELECIALNRLSVIVIDVDNWTVNESYRENIEKRKKIHCTVIGIDIRTGFDAFSPGYKILSWKLNTAFCGWTSLDRNCIFSN